MSFLDFEDADQSVQEEGMSDIEDDDGIEGYACVYYVCDTYDGPACGVYRE